MNTKAIFTIVAIMAAIGVLGMHAIPSVPHAMAQGVQGNNNNHGASVLADNKAITTVKAKTVTVTATDSSNT